MRRQSLAGPVGAMIGATALCVAAGVAMASDAATVQQSSSELPVGIYATGAGTSYCPAGLRPVSVDGTTSCGMPNRTETYAEAKRTPYRRSYRSYDCAVGIKGCD